VRGAAQVLLMLMAARTTSITAGTHERRFPVSAERVWKYLSGSLGDLLNLFLVNAFIAFIPQAFGFLFRFCMRGNQ
jgi:hypothetical protein